MSRSGRAFHARPFFPSGGRALAWLVAPAIALALPIGCDTREDDAAPAAQAAQSTRQFNVDEKLIGDAQPFEAFGVEVSPPAGWTALPEDQVAAVAAAVNGGAGGAGAATQAAATEGEPSAEVETSDNLVPEPLAVFARPDEGRWLIVSGIRVPEPEVYTARLREQHERLDTDQFLLQGIEVHQYRSFPKGMVNFRLLLAAPGRPDERRLQLDYVFPARDYAEMGRVLESSIGSIKPLRQAEG